MTFRTRLLACFVLVASVTPLCADDVVDSPMYRDPDFVVPPVVHVYPASLVPLWLQAFDRPEVDLRCQAALAIAAAHERKVPGLQVTIPPLIREVERADQHSSVRIAAAQALVLMDAKEAAASLLKAVAVDGDLREIVEPALAKWNYAPAREEWLRRIGQPPPHRRPVMLAIQGLATLREEKAIPRLREIVLAADTVPTIRVEASRALSVIKRSGSESDADALAVDASPTGIVKRVAAATLLRHHDGTETITRLQKYGVDSEPAVAGVALARLTEIDTKHIIPLLPKVLASPDANVRTFGVETLFRQPSESHIGLLGVKLSDPHPDVRAKARRSLRELATKPMFTAWIISTGEKSLAGSDWRGKEQASYLLAQLDHKPARTRLLELLHDARPEVAVASAWALRTLAMPDTLPKVLEYVRTYSKRGDIASIRKLPGEALDNQLCQLVQFIGKSMYREADAVLRAMVPKRDQYGQPEARAAACWTLGLFYADKLDSKLVAAFVDRLEAVKPFDFEDERVRRMCAIALGRMKAKSALPSLKNFGPEQKPTLFVVPNACSWAIEQITGEKVAAPVPIEIPQRIWFLSPLTDK